MYKELYLLHTPTEIPIFHKPFYLDVVTNKSWDVCAVIKNNEIIATLPYYIRKYKGITFLDMPPLNQFLGPWIKPDILKNISYRKYHEIIETLYSQLPEFGCCNHHWHYTYQNWLPLYWKGFKQTTRYTYIIPFEQSIETTWENINYSTKREISKCQQNYKVESLDDFDAFFNLVKENFLIKKKNNPLNYSMFSELDKACRINNNRLILGAFDNSKSLHGVIYLLFDSSSVYYIAGGCDSTGFKDEAIKLLIWEAIKIANERKLVFDFEGSMMKNVEFFFNSFGSIQQGYFAISKVNSKRLLINEFVKNILKKKSDL
jgi:hypothetical protein